MSPTHLDKDSHILQVFSMPLVEGFQQLQTIAGGTYVHLNNIESVLDIKVLQRLFSQQHWGKQLPDQTEFLFEDQKTFSV